jgi:hypothetical protein
MPLSYGHPIVGLPTDLFTVDALRFFHVETKLYIIIYIALVLQIVKQRFGINAFFLKFM